MIYIATSLERHLAETKKVFIEGYRSIDVNTKHDIITLWHVWRTTLWKNFVGIVKIAHDEQFLFSHNVSHLHSGYIIHFVHIFHLLFIRCGISTTDALKSFIFSTYVSLWEDILYIHAFTYPFEMCKKYPSHSVTFWPPRLATLGNVATTWANVAQRG